MASRLKLTESQAARYAKDLVLGRAGPVEYLHDCPWVPEPGLIPGLTSRAQAITVEPGQPGQLQRAIDRAIAAAQISDHRGPLHLALLPGRYDGLVYLPHAEISGKPLRITLTGMGQSPADVEICANIDAEMPGAEYLRRFGAQIAQAGPEAGRIYTQIAASERLSTAFASVVRVEAADTRLANLTIRNSYNCDRAAAAEGDKRLNAQGQYAQGQHQAVALLVAGADRVALDRLHLRSHQDTLYLQGPAPGVVARAALTNCHIEGDVDFIFGQMAAHFHRCTLKSLGHRAPMAWVTAPATHIHAPYGFVFEECDFTHDGSAAALSQRFLLGRQWFEGVRATPYGRAPMAGYRCDYGPSSRYDPPLGVINRKSLEAVGKCILLKCRLGAHLNPAMPWGDWNGGAYDAAGRYHPAPWHPRYRPVQSQAGDFLAELGPWLAAQGLDFSGLDPKEPWLAEYQSQALAEDASQTG
ncbi:MAG: pectinesterase family protein [Mangrovicoccus sp.]